MTAAETGDAFATTLAEAARALEADPQTAARLARDLLAAAPRDPRARLVLGAALRRSGDLTQARDVLEPLARVQPNSAPAQLELGLVLEALAEDAAASAFFERALQANPRLPEACRAKARLAARRGDLDGAVTLLREAPRHIPPSSGVAFDLATLLHRRQDDGEALALAESLAASDPGDDSVAGLLAACSARVGDYSRAAALYRDVLERHPGQADLWLSLGHALRALGKRSEAVEAYRRCLAIAPEFGEAFWSLANLKAGRPSSGDGSALRTALGRSDVGAEDGLHLHYALGALLEEAERYEESFTHYAAGATLCRQVRPYDAGSTLAAMSPDRLDLPADVLERAAAPHPPNGPIFVVGLPRAGSTLIEQILASHSEVEGCGELPTLMGLARTLAAESPDGYPACVASLDPSRLAVIGERYLTETRIYRRQGRRRFVDKMPNNLHHIALIRLALPGCRIIDARRAPMAAGFSLFKQHFAAGHAFSYDLSAIGHYYRAYADLMARHDAIMPGAVLRVDYERLVLDTEAEVRRLLAFCGLDFEPACLAFHANARSVRTASSEQVRRPIYTQGLEQWRRYEPWLGPLARALAPRG